MIPASTQPVFTQNLSSEKPASKNTSKSSSDPDSPVEESPDFDEMLNLFDPRFQEPVTQSAGNPKVGWVTTQQQESTLNDGFQLTLQELDVNPEETTPGSESDPIVELESLAEQSNADDPVLDDSDTTEESSTNFKSVTGSIESIDSDVKQTPVEMEEPNHSLQSANPQQRSTSTIQPNHHADGVQNYVEQTLNPNPKIDTNPKVTSQPVIQQVVSETMDRMSMVRKVGTSDFTVRLDPPELGEVLVKLRKADDGIKVRVRAVNSETQTLVADNIQNLSDALLEFDSTLDLMSDAESHAEFEQQKFEVEDSRFDRLATAPNKAPTKRPTSKSVIDFWA